MKYIFYFLILMDHAFLLAQDYPEPRDHFAATYDTDRNKLILFGGNGNVNSAYLSDLWEFDGESWEKKSDQVMTPRSSHAMAFISHLNKTILFGGISKEGQYLLDMGLWDGNNWQEMDGGPSPRYSPGIAYDEGRKALVVFSGAGRGEDLMWEYRDGVWEEIELGENKPSARTRTQMVYDYAREKVILFGGYAEGKSAGDMWEWDGESWERLQVETPPARNNHLMVSDEKRKRVMLYGGKNRQNDILYGDTWEWNGKVWKKVSDQGPEPRDMTAGAYDPNTGKVFLFGGRDANRKKLDDFWSWDGKTWAKISN